MTDLVINAENVFNTASLLVEDSVYQHQIIPKESVNIKKVISDLKTALYNFKHPFEGRTSGEYSPMLLFDEYLTRLLSATKNMYVILSDESKKFVKDLVEEKQKDFKGYHRNISSGNPEN